MTPPQTTHDDLVDYDDFVDDDDVDDPTPTNWWVIHRVGGKST